jgi:hypothetical protein
MVNSRTELAPFIEFIAALWLAFKMRRKIFEVPVTFDGNIAASMLTQEKAI